MQIISKVCRNEEDGSSHSRDSAFPDTQEYVLMSSLHAQCCQPQRLPDHYNQCKKSNVDLHFLPTTNKKAHIFPSTTSLHLLLYFKDTSFILWRLAKRDGCVMPMLRTLILVLNNTPCMVWSFKYIIWTKYMKQMLECYNAQREPFGISRKAIKVPLGGRDLLGKGLTSLYKWELCNFMLWGLQMGSQPEKETLLSSDCTVSFGIGEVLFGNCYTIPESAQINSVEQLWIPFYLY